MVLARSGSDQGDRTVVAARMVASGMRKATCIPITVNAQSSSYTMGVKARSGHTRAPACSGEGLGVSEDPVRYKKSTGCSGLAPDRPSCKPAILDQEVALGLRTGVFFRSTCCRRRRSGPRRLSIAESLRRHYCHARNAQHDAAASRGARSLAPPLSDAVTGRPSGAELANVSVS